MNISWPTVLDAINQCTACRLHQGILHKVPGQGNPDARLMVIGEGPGAEEDRQGLAFVGPAGMMLTKMLAAIQVAREDVYIANIVKCRPPKNRVPTREEADCCKNHLRAQVALVKPQIILLMGATALQAIISPYARITAMRGTWIERKGVWMLPTFHPAALLRDASKKPEAWYDMQMVQEKLASLGDKVCK